MSRIRNVECEVDRRSWSRASFFHREGKQIRCDLCPHRCLLSAGEIGLCGARRSNAEEMETATFSVAVKHLDAIERKPLYHVRPGARVLTLAAPGCTFRCSFCLNHRLSHGSREAWSRTRPVDAVALAEEAARAGAFIALSYSEPVLATELTLALAQPLRERGAGLLWKTNAFMTAETLNAVAGELTAVNVDLKTADDTAHLRLTGAPLAPVLDAVHGLLRAGVWVEISTPVIPGVNDGEASLSRLAAMVRGFGRDIPWHLVRFLPANELASLPPSSPQLLQRARAIGLREGLRYVYVERSLGQAARETRCPWCTTLLVTRGIWCTQAVYMDRGACPRCGAPIPGLWCC